MTLSNNSESNKNISKTKQMVLDIRDAANRLVIKNLRKYGPLIYSIFSGYDIHTNGKKYTLIKSSGGTSNLGSAMLELSYIYSHDPRIQQALDRLSAGDNATETHQIFMQTVSQVAQDHINAPLEEILATLHYQPLMRR